LQPVSNNPVDQLPAIENLRLLTQNDWTRFTVILEEVYPGIMKKVQMKFPELTPAEERIFLLIFIKTENKDIAAIFRYFSCQCSKSKVSPETEIASAD